VSFDDDWYEAEPRQRRTFVGAAFGAGVAVGRAALWPARPLVALGLEIEREARERLLDAGARTTLAALDALLASPFLGQATELVLARAEAAGAPQRLTERVLADGIAEELAARVVNGPEIERLVEVTLDSDRLRDAVLAALEQPAAERMVSDALESPGMERLVTRVVGSRLVEETIVRIVDETVARLPEREALWTLIDEIARSDSVTDAIGQQGLGFADQVADDVRERSRHADARLERVARRLLRRPQRNGLPPDPLAEPEP
jgi:hypothetical protein